MKSRFAPSPTGYLHIGGARTAFFAWIWAKKQHGKFVLRIENTDLERSTQASTDAILQGIDWLGLNYDEGPLYQTDRFDRYKQIIQYLLDEKKAYYCECSKNRLQILREELTKQGKKAKYDGCCRDKNLHTGVVRFNNPKEGIVVFNDVVKGKISINNQELDDLVIARSDNTPTYNLTAVIDDHDMKINIIIRGDDHINNTPKQINLYQALGWHLPEFAHLPMILGNDGIRLSKRHGAVSVMAYRDAGFLPEALLNYLSRLGWSYGNQEIFSINEIIQLFELKNINKASANFNQDKLLWFNKETIKSSSVKNLLSNLTWHLQNQEITIKDIPNIEIVIRYLQNRCKTLVNMAGELKMFYQDFDNFDEKLAKKLFKDKAPLKHLLVELEMLNTWKANNIKQVVKQVCFELNIDFGRVGQPFRLALSGDGNAGSIDIVAELVGKNKALLRLKMAIDF
ncbi:glutamate--tRNA ligase [Candidatus Vesicomyidisocius sp. SY067_SCS001]|uniref:glutamate--tRNA ligase n=1 Tax=Candidatus Vesicomyidisocius sp. SY067_SCS001 TaxID=2732590 RepID=UPI001684ECEB|nr:glutamate--tRNA ligase [Candidatus Vesicomyosocius sp. SY067_SCS001]